MPKRWSASQHLQQWYVSPRQGDFLRPAILRFPRTLKQHMLRFAGPNASQPSQRISHSFEKAISHLSRMRFLASSAYATVSNRKGCLVPQRQCDPHRLKRGKAPSFVRCACNNWRKMLRCVRSERSPPRPSQKRKPCLVSCDQLRILTCDGQATSGHAHTCGGVVVVCR